MELTKTRLRAGVWEGVLTTQGRSAAPDLAVTLDGQPVDGLTVKARGNGKTKWDVTLTILSNQLSDGVQTYVIADRVTDTVLTSFILAAGDVLADECWGELELLRAELEMLKRAFRRHCAETT